MADCNIIQWLEKIFTDQEAEELLEIYNAYTDSNTPMALFPFVSHETLSHVVRIKYNDERATPSQFADLRLVSKYEKFMSKLDVDTYWVSLSTIGDEYRKEYNTVTEELRAIDDADEIFGNVHSSL